VLRAIWRHVLFAAGAVLLVWLLSRVGLGAIGEMARRLGWWSSAALVAIYALHQALRAGALYCCVVRPGSVRYTDALAVRLSGEGAQILTAGGAAVGEPFKAWLFTRRGLTGQEGLAATLTDFLVYKFVSAIVMLAGLVYLAGRVELPGLLAAAVRVFAIGAAVFLAVSATAILRRTYLIGGVVAATARVPGVARRIRYAPAWVRGMEDLIFGVLRDRPARFAGVLALSAAAHVLLVLELWLMLHSMDLARPLFHAWLVDASTKPLGGLFFFVPGQVGAIEAALAGLFTALGLPAAAGVLVALVRRARSLLVAAVGLAGLWWVERQPG
jgi:uncharacterized membrane protein YbhN (UPF0104 family)